MVTVPGGSYTVWTTTLNSQGEHSPWLRGPEVLPWKSTNEYSISKELQFEDSSRSTVRAKFQWDRNDGKLIEAIMIQIDMIDIHFTIISARNYF